MADSNDTLRQMMGGFSAMQYQMGLLPMQQAQAMAGAASPYQAPPPPQLTPPGIAAQQALQQQQAMMQQSLQAAQVARYQPPPSAPTPAVSALVGFGAMNPFAAPALGSGGGFGGGYGGGAFGSNGMKAPSIYNPFSPTVLPAQFSTPAAQGLQQISRHQHQAMGMGVGVMTAGAGMLGSALGGMLGSAFGPLGTMAGSWLGGKAGTYMASVAAGPVIQDYARANQIQHMSASYLNSGAIMNPFTGQGMDGTAARQTARGLRNLQRDQGFTQTGYNIQDTMNIMDFAGPQGLLTGAQSPDQMVAKVKEVAKTVSALMKITGDPDVRNAIQSLGDMRNLGFQGLGAQAGAVANRTAFARMAGVSVGQMESYGQMGVGIANAYDLAGATGQMAGMAGGTTAHLARSSEALNALQLARGGGVAGVAQINAQAQLAAMNDNRYMAASLVRGKDGKLTVDANLYRQAQGLSLDDVARTAAEKLRALGSEGNMVLASRGQEFKDMLAQKLSPLELTVGMYQQAGAVRDKLHTDMGGAFRAMGMDETTARTLALQGESGAFWDAQIGQVKVQRRNARTRDQAERNRYRTAGAGTRIRRGIGGVFESISDGISAPFRSFADHMEHVAEDNDAFAHGELISRYSDVGIVRSEGERRNLRNTFKGSRFTRAYATDVGRGLADIEETSFGTRMGQRIGAMFGVTRTGVENQLVKLANSGDSAFMGWRPFDTFGDAKLASRTVAGVRRTAEAYSRGGALSIDDAVAATKRLQTTAKPGANTDAALAAATNTLRTSLAGNDMMYKDSAGDIHINGFTQGDGGAAGLFTPAGNVRGDMMERAGVAFYKNMGHSDAESLKLYKQNAHDVDALLARNIKLNGTSQEKERFMKSLDLRDSQGGLNYGRSRNGMNKWIKDLKAEAGLSRKRQGSEGGAFADGMVEISVKDQASLKAFFASDAVVREGDDGHLAASSVDKIALAAAISNDSGAGTPEAKAQAQQVIRDMQAKYKDDYTKLFQEASVMAGGMDKGALRALRQVNNVGRAADVGKRVQAADVSSRAEMHKAATDAFMKHVATVTGDPTLGGEDLDVLARKDVLDKLAEGDPELAKKIQAAQAASKASGKEVDYSEIVPAYAPTANKVISGGGRGANVRENDKQLQQLQAAKEAFSKTADAAAPETAAVNAQLEATTTFAASVSKFEKSIDELYLFITAQN